MLSGFSSYPLIIIPDWRREGVQKEEMLWCLHYFSEHLRVPGWWWDWYCQRSSQNRYWIIQPTNKMKQNHASLDRTLHWVVWNNFACYAYSRELLKLEQMFPFTKYSWVWKINIWSSVDLMCLQVSKCHFGNKRQAPSMQLTGDGREPKLCLSAKHGNAPKF